MCYKLYMYIVFSTDRIDDLDIRVKQFFMNCRKAKPEWKEQQYKQIRDVRSTYKTINFAIIMQIERVSNENGLSHNNLIHNCKYMYMKLSIFLLLYCICTQQCMYLLSNWSNCIKWLNMPLLKLENMWVFFSYLPKLCLLRKRDNVCGQISNHTCMLAPNES